MPDEARTAASLRDASRDEIRRVFDLQRKRVPELRRTGAEQRVEKIQRLRAAVLDSREALIEALGADLGKPPIEVDVTEIGVVDDEAKWAAKHLKRWMRPRRVRTPLKLWGTRSEIRLEPKGMGLIFSPFNYPFNLTFAPLVGAIAAGCTAVLKPSELTPNTSRLIAKLAGEVFDESEVAVFEGGQAVGEMLLALPFDHIYFTGSPAVGRIVMRAAAEHLASVTLELGGKSPTIVDDTADVQQAAASIARARFSNAGQTCIAPDYVLVHESLHDALVAALKDTIQGFYGATEEERAASPDYGRIVTHHHQRRVLKLRDAATAAGAVDLLGGAAAEGSRFVPPSLLTDVPADSELMDQEIFGPVLPILRFGDLDEAIRVVREKPNPLSLYIFSNDERNIEHILTETTAGGTVVNDSMLHFLHLELPFGGAGASGIGEAHGKATFLAFSNQRPVMRRIRSSPAMKLIQPPYSERARKLLDWVGRKL